ncbi:PRC-barrel domain containing protein [Halobacteria archaeon AArc-m2/3/4]|uniref:PRC-barrel domain containing protein n=1 Tax=Natronoglomus mannanivorans TaxID=2979990 RepID=A0AAP3E4E4_9EURY|nr:PRC-barrel domain containing protein [Halobacteria archaeon AArc-xg1-1]MCU4974371.1 PRC-barrel domain containing protein [Halobacteria archaeon AArc-m2/3/4]
MTRNCITPEDEGKRVLNADGLTIGRLIAVKDGLGYVDPDPSITDTIKARLGWSDVSDTAHPLHENNVETVSADAIRLRNHLP